MSYYNPSYSQSVGMSRGRGFSSRGSPYRGGSRGSRGGYSSSRGSGGGGRFSSSFSSNNSFESRSRSYHSSPNEKYGSSRYEEFRKPYKSESGGYSSREHRSSPDRKRLRKESSPDRSFGGIIESPRYRIEGGFSGDRRPQSYIRKEEFRKPAPPSSPRGGYRGRVSSRRSIRGSRFRERPTRRRLAETSYAVRKPAHTIRIPEFKRHKVAKMRSAIVKRIKKEAESDKEEESDNEAEEEKKEKSVTEGDISDKEDEQTDEKRTTPKKKEEVATSVKEEKAASDTEEKKKFITLTCPHCLVRCTTFAKYSSHLQSGRHVASMRRVAMKQKSILSQMRLVQRKAQRELEKSSSELAPRTSWCPLCKLNYKQLKATHQSSQAHKDMKKFLMPYCKICKTSFKSPMMYETHCSSIDHIKRKAAVTNGNKSDNEEDLENFMTIDSVGDMDDEAEPTEKKDSVEITKTKEQINVGIENIKKVDVYYCDLCRMYLSRSSDEDEMNKMISRHCKNRTHLQKYIRYKEDKDLAKKAERLQRKEIAEKEKAKDVKDETKEEEKMEEGEEKAEEKSKETGDEEKIWEDVDKDLGDILAEANSGNKSSDEDEEDSVANGERYDKFKITEKKCDEHTKVDNEEEMEDKTKEATPAEK